MHDHAQHHEANEHGVGNLFSSAFLHADALFFAHIDPLNNSGVHGEAVLALNGNILTVEIAATGLDPAFNDATGMNHPNSDILEVEAKLAPQDIDQVRLGQPSTLRLSAFNQRTTPELNGIVSRVSPDLITDTKTGANSYLIRIKFLETELTRLDGVRLVPGMPVEAFIGTGDRTVISYLTKPFTDQVARAFRSR